MTLTELWKDGQLEDGFYYFRLPDGSIDIASEYRLIRYRLTKDSDKMEVLAPVPSYDEWVYLHKAKNDAHEIVESLTQENKQLKELLLKIRKRQSLIREYLSDCKLGNAWDLLYQTENEIDNAIGEKK